MKSAKTMLAWCAIVACLVGCANERQLTAPKTIEAPYDTSRGEVLWAVAPLRNESGTKEVNIGEMSDLVVAAVEQVRGVRTVPLNRTIEAMRALELPALRTPSDARRLAQAMGVDGILVGSITAYDPYTPVLGISLALFARPGSLADRGPNLLNPRKLQESPVDPGPAGSTQYSESPLVVVSEHLDAKNHQVLMDVQQYAVGRQSGRDSYGWERYTRSMVLYSEFAAFQAVDKLMRAEWIRMGKLEMAAGSDGK